MYSKSGGGLYWEGIVRNFRVRGLGFEGFRASGLGFRAFDTI